MTTVRHDRALPKPRRYDVTSADGTRLTGWSNDNVVTDPDAVDVLLCNGLGTGPYAWPALFDPECGVRVHSWYYRGTGGAHASDRPEDVTRLGVDVYVEDALAVMDAAGLSSAPALAWSIGVNVMFELATRHPDRLTSLTAVAGVPGETFSSMLQPFGLPRRLNERVAVTIAQGLRYTGKAFSPITKRIPTRSPWPTRKLLSHSGVMFPGADRPETSAAVYEFLQTPVDWYFRMAMHAHEHERVDLASIAVPTMFIAGRYDLLAGPRDMQRAAEAIDGAEYVSLTGGHFIPLERPEEVHALLRRNLARAAS